LIKYRLLSLISCLLLLAFSIPPCDAKQWGDFVPLHTTRAEVLRLLGSPKHEPSDNSEYFDLATEIATFRWIRANCGTQSSVTDERSIQLNDLVLQITVKPKSPSHLKDLDPDKSRPRSLSYWLEEDLDCIGNGEGGVWNCSIINGREGFGYSTSKDLVTAVYYFPSDAEAEAWNREHESCAPKSEKGE
jgi:hypothetical protein